MKDDRNAPVIALDPSELLGLSQVVKVSGKQDALGRLLCKVGEGPPPPVAPMLPRLLSKIGTEGPINPD